MDRIWTRSLQGPPAPRGGPRARRGRGGLLVAYSTPEEAYREIVPAFNKTPEGEGVGFDHSYAASGEQSRAVEGGLRPTSSSSRSSPT